MAEFWRVLLTTGTFCALFAFIRAARDLIVPLAGAYLDLSIEQIATATAVGEPPLPPLLLCSVQAEASGLYH